jgi:putative Mg2+ transporter-C (MgtC) family protein
MEIEDELHILLRLSAAIVCGLVIGFNRDVQDKALGMRTLALVSMGAAIAAIAALEFDDAVQDNADALSRVIQGILQGVLAGIGFIGAGVILRDPARQKVVGLTTAATVWIAAALGIACALDAWLLVITGTVLAFIILQILPVIEQKALPTGSKNKKKH